MSNGISQFESMSQSQIESSEDHFKHGNLVSLKLQNFMTFDYLDLSAGANLNFVLGPNGTGKSAVVCSLILGLGGEASHTGRPGSLAEYIQFGKQQCSILIELFNSEGTNFIIGRSLQRRSNSNSENSREPAIKSDWSLNGKKSKLQDIKELISSLNIFTDNLCQFLPQEKVVEFCKLNKQQLLLNTEKAVGNIQMFEDHEKLIKLSLEERKNRDELSNLQKQFEKFDQLNQHYEQQVRVIRERKETENLIKLYNMKKPWLEYERTGIDYKHLKARVNTFEKKLQEKKNKLPFDRILIKKNAELKKLDTKLKDKGQTGHLIRQNDKFKQEMQKFTSKEKDEVYKYNMQFKKMREQQQNIENLNKEIRLLTNQMESIEEEKSLEEKADRLEEEIKTHVERNTRRHDEKFQVKRDVQKIEERLIQKKTLLKCETNVLDQRMQMLRQADERLYEITKWLEKNKNQFAGQIFPPMMLSINAKKPEYINLIESLIPKKDMLAFICTDDRDIVKFNEIVNREFRYRVSVLTTPDCDLSRFVERRNERLLEYFTMFASDMFTCPNEILAYLYSQAHLHEIPVNIPSSLDNQSSQQNSQSPRRSSSRFNSQQSQSKVVNLEEVERAGLNLRRCIANGNIYTIQRSEYDGEAITEIKRIQKAQLLCGVQNEDKIRQYKREISELELEMQEFTLKLSEIEQEFKKEQDCMTEDKEKLNVINNKQNERLRLKHKIEMFGNKLRTLQEFEIDLDREKGILSGSLKEIVNKKIDLINSYNKQLEKQYQDDIKFIYDLYNQVQIKKQIAYVDQLSKKYEEQFKYMEEELQHSKDREKELKKKCDELFKEAHKATNTNPNSNLPRSIKEKFDQIPDSLDELSSEIRKLELKLIFSTDNLDGQDETQRSYHDNKQQLTATKSKLDALNQQQESIMVQKEELKTNWLNEIHKLIKQISEKFQLFMRRLNFDGFVRLYRDEDEADYEKYGISVLVRYREEEECAELEYNKHSGGERSIATMIYIIALQKLTAVPFRVVDEINQGMDDTNERNVLKLIMELSKEDSSQYFILSPKLVPGLTFNEKCDFQFIFNGAFNFANFKV